MQNQMSNWQAVAVFITTMIVSSISIVLPFYLISRDERLIEVLAKGGGTYLRFITIALVVWSASALAMVGRMDEGPSAIFGMIVGYVFGMGRPTAAPIPVNLPDHN